MCEYGYRGDTLDWLGCPIDASLDCGPGRLQSAEFSEPSSEKIIIMLSPEEAKRLEKLTRTHQPGEVIIEDGDFNFDLFILTSGQVEIIKNDQVLAVVDEPGTLIGEMSTLLQAPRGATVRTTKLSRIIRIPEESVEKFFQMAPHVGWKLAKMLADRLQRANKEVSRWKMRYERLSLGNSRASGPTASVETEDGDDVEA